MIGGLGVGLLTRAPATADAVAERPPVASARIVAPPRSSPDPARTDDSRAQRATQRECAREEGEVELLQAKVAELGQQLDRERLKAVMQLDKRVYPLSTAELEVLAANCELRVDVPGLPSAEQAADMELTAEELVHYREARASALAWQGRIRDEIWQAQFGANMPKIEGRDPTEALAVLERRNTQVKQLVGASLGRQGYAKQLARERAGLQEPAVWAELSAYERFERAGDDLGEYMQEELAQRVGEQRAADVRTVHGGWPGSRGTTRGCAVPEAD